MLKFFKKIRRKLINEGNLKRYLIYAIGEIILVTIGILLAFQVNMRNERQKASALEKQHLINLQSELSQSIIQLDESINFNAKTLRHINNILNHIENDLPYSQSLDSSFYIYQYYIIPELSFTTYETIKEVGINTINPIDLRLAISKLYEEDFSFLNNSIKENEKAFYQNIVTEIHVNHFKETSLSQLSIPNDYKAIKVNKKYSNMLYKLKGIRIYSINSLKNVKTKTSTLSKKITNKLDS